MARLGILVGVFAIAVLLTGLVRQYALRGFLMDIPNARSSHTIATPRGGGLGIVGAFLLALSAGYWWEWVELNTYLGFVIPGVLIAAIGFLDDHGGVPVRWRLLGHFIAAMCITYWIGGLDVIFISGYSINLGVVGVLVSMLFVVWMLNLYNFMDGIDALAGVEAVTVCGAGAFISWFFASADSYIALSLSIAAAGFLLWNTPPARIFMGDIGSAFVGAMLAALVLKTAVDTPSLLWSWLILPGVFIVDATWTLLVRFATGQAVSEGHRSHAYQLAARRFSSHGKISIAVGVINLVWLFPIALWAAAAPQTALLAVIIAYTPLWAVAFYLGAGARERTV